jgi:uncharacterized membrane protein YphA (DoxX/SURF4 family)
MSQYYKIGRVAVWSIVLLRVAIGWHFFMEGQSKVKEGNFSSKGFLAAAKGPLAPLYHQAIWDYDGNIRLDEKQMTDIFAAYQTKAVDYFVFTEEQTTQAKELSAQALGELKEVFDQWGEDIYKFNEGRQRVEEMNRDPMRLFVASLRSQKDKIESDRLNSVRPALGSIDKIMSNYQAKINALATEEQRKLPENKGTRPDVVMDLPGATPFQTDMVDKFVPIFDMSIGILLIVGLLTRIASLAAAGFLFSVVLSQFPGFEGTAPTYFQAVEALACLVLFSTDAGRYAGLDFLPWSMWQFARQDKAAATSK